MCHCKTSNNTASGGDAEGDTISGFENLIGSDHNDDLAGNNISGSASFILGGVTAATEAFFERSGSLGLGDRFAQAPATMEEVVRYFNEHLPAPSGGGASGFEQKAEKEK